MKTLQSAGENIDFPPKVAFKTKPQLAIEMLEKLSARWSIPFRCVVADAIYGGAQKVGGGGKDSWGYVFGFSALRHLLLVAGAGHYG